MKRLLLALTLALAAFTAQADPNIGKVILASAARTTTPINSADQINTTAKCAHVIIDVTAFTAGTYTFTIQGKDPASGKYYTILASTAIGATGTTVLKVCPGLTASANAAVNDLIPYAWRVNVVGASSQNMTFSVGASIIE